jgi:glucuronoarabinoxylan endo-1,4-beta-xylanase
MKLSKSYLMGFLLLFVYVPQIRAQTAIVNWNNVDQVIDGFGGSDSNNLAPMTPAQAALMFSTTSGIGLSFLRTAIPSDGSCSTVNATCAGKISDMQLAIANGARVWSTSWSPPASMKSNGSVDNGGSLLPSSYDAYATYLANYVVSLKNNGIDLYALSVQNEPQSSVYYASAIWSPANFDVFIGNNLGPTFAAAALNTLIIMPETSIWQDLPAYATANMSDPIASAYVSIYATHDYSHAGTLAYPIGGKRLWETEVCDDSSGVFDPSMTSALQYAQYINDWMTIANANAWHVWWLYGQDGDDQGLVDGSGNVSKRFYMIGNYSKFVRPGFYRIGATATPQSGVFVSAYKNSATGALVIVVINQNSSNVTQSFSLTGATTSTMTPWITSASLNLALQSDVSVSGGTFAYHLPGYSITSFVGSITLESRHPAALSPPTRLAAKIQ